MIRFLLFFLLLFKRPSEATVCLNMMVKDQANTIKRCLDSVKPFIDCWVIVDVGSTDGTQECIRQYLKDIPGELFDRPWRNFGENRTEALELAKTKGDYLLFMDGEDVLEWEKGVQLPLLDKDVYLFWQGTRTHACLKPLVAKATLPLKWVGVTHEYLDCGKSYTSETIANIRCTSDGKGINARDPKRAWKAVKLLEEALKKEPENTRYAFYLAESYRDAGEKGKALECFQKRVQMNGWDEEVFWSLLQIGHMLTDLGLSPSIVIEAYKQAHAFRPHRVEATYYLAELYNNQGSYALAYELLKTQETLPKPLKKDTLFNQEWIERYGLLFQLSICSYYVGKYDESLDLCNYLLAMEQFPRLLRKQVEVNRAFPLSKLKN